MLPEELLGELGGTAPVVVLVPVPEEVVLPVPEVGLLVEVPEVLGLVPVALVPEPDIELPVPEVELPVAVPPVLSAGGLGGTVPVALVLELGVALVLGAVVLVSVELPDVLLLVLVLGVVLVDGLVLEDDDDVEGLVPVAGVELVPDV